jgi:hypothetical protein
LQPKREIIVERKIDNWQFQNGSYMNLLSAYFVRRNAIAKSKR